MMTILHNEFRQSHLNVIQLYGVVREHKSYNIISFGIIHFCLLNNKIIREYLRINLIICFEYLKWNIKLLTSDTLNSLGHDKIKKHKKGILFFKF